MWEVCVCYVLIINIILLHIPHLHLIISHPIPIKYPFGPIYIEPNGMTFL